jgi:hypothetical protein
MGKINNGMMEISSRIPPKFLLFRNVIAGTTLELIAEFVVPENRDLKILSATLHAEASGGETTDMLHIEIYPVGTNAANPVLLDHGPGGGAAVREILRFVPGGDCIIPRNYVVRFHAFYSAAVQAKTLDANLVGFLLHPMDSLL